jgi:phospholipid/cholesterol/gamma-HCH transport system substrate-binding protein
MTTSSHTLRAGVGLITFLVVSAVVTIVIAATIHPLTSTGTTPYRALFTDASHLSPNDDVRVAGVQVGRVKAVSVTRSGAALVTFDVDPDVSLTTGTRAAVRYLNLVGDRYLTLEEGAGKRLRTGATIPANRTQPALDLSELFDGFKPLFAALSPDDVNKLAASIISTLQGEGSTVSDLLRQTADVTNTLADKDVVIGRVVQNLDATLATVDRRQSELTDLIVQLDQLMNGLADDRHAISASLKHIDAMAAVTTDLLHEARPGLRKDIADIGKVASGLNKPKNKALVEKILETTPTKLDRVSRAGSYGSWFNFYVCDVGVRLKPDAPLLNLTLSPFFDQIRRVQLHDTTPRCTQ